MISTESPITVNKTERIKMTRGCTFLTVGETNLLRLRSKVHQITVSGTIQEVVQPVIEKFETSSPEEQKGLLSGYMEQVRNRIRMGANAFLDSQEPPFVLVYWVLPRDFISTMNKIGLQGRLTNESLMNIILSDAINGR